MMRLITVCERHEIEEIIGKEIKRAYDLYPLGFEATVEIKSEVAGVYSLPHYVDLKVKVCPTKRAVELGDSAASQALSTPEVNPVVGADSTPAPARVTQTVAKCPQGEI